MVYIGQSDRCDRIRIFLAVVFKGTVVEGAWGACESLGEGLMYITVWTYWKKQK